MKPLGTILTVLLLLFTVTNACSQKSSPESTSIVGVFVGNTPCSQGTRPLPGMDTSTDCELMQWKLTLYEDKRRAPATFQLHCDYGLPQQGTPGLDSKKKSVDLSGNWVIIKGSPGPRDVVYQLHDHQTGKIISFLKLNNTLLHLLDDEQRLMVGNGAWSYTLSKITHK
ncbi:hypothetical protein [Chitinophaga barathri]|uniref:Lipocalin-like domain-containing protein n=1 Tax=Chitinophaga barathri TaxID=1647451 RepID=A0A3N4ME12_9BACT|nr:hypothetical protein [Chitinophaga barathri]RPD42011.1 hypothetical protein EG028_07615 [Chitinophaga barathri]